MQRKSLLLKTKNILSNPSGTTWLPDKALGQTYSNLASSEKLTEEKRGNNMQCRCLENLYILNIVKNNCLFTRKYLEALWQ